MLDNLGAASYDNVSAEEPPHLHEIRDRAKDAKANPWYPQSWNGRSQLKQRLDGWDVLCISLHLVHDESVLLVRRPIVFMLFTPCCMNSDVLQRTSSERHLRRRRVDLMFEGIDLEHSAVMCTQGLDHDRSL